MIALSPGASDTVRTAHHKEVFARIEALLAQEQDCISAMATVVCELHYAFAYLDWTGFYRAVGPTTLRVGPYQGSHGCLEIDFARGVCGAAARTLTTQNVPNVHAFPGHIACSSTTCSELVVPVVTPNRELLAVLDLDSDIPGTFTTADVTAIERLCTWLGDRFKDTPQR